MAIHPTIAHKIGRTAGQHHSRIQVRGGKHNAPLRSTSATRRKAPPTTPSDIAPEAVKNITGALNTLLADIFALYVKTKNSPPST